MLTVNCNGALSVSDLYSNKIILIHTYLVLQILLVPSDALVLFNDTSVKDYASDSPGMDSILSGYGDYIDVNFREFHMDETNKREG